MNVNVISLVRKGVPFMVGLCSSSVVEKLISSHLPETTGFWSKLAAKAGVMGISTVVTAKVCESVEKELGDFMDVFGLTGEDKTEPIPVETGGC